jgi:hypothetical protein
MKNEKTDLFEACCQIAVVLLMSALWAMAMAGGVFILAERFTPHYPNIPIVIAWVAGVIMFGGLANAVVRASWLAYKKGSDCKEFMPALFDCVFAFMATWAVGCVPMLACLASVIIDRIASGGAPDVTTWQGHVACIVMLVGSWGWLIWLLMTAVNECSKKAQ